MIRFVIRFLMAGPLVVAISACSAVPDFKPSKPPEEASSAEEALDVCASYQIDGKTNSGGAAMPSRASTLVPWMRCFETVLRKFPTAQDNESFVIFYRDLQLRYDSVPTPEAEVIDWPAMNFVVKTVVGRLKDPGRVLKGEERTVIEKELPGYSIYLAEHGAFSDPIATAKQSGAGSRALPAPGPGYGKEFELAGDVAGEDLPAPRPVKLSSSQRSYCERYLNYRHNARTVEELRAYLRILEASTYRDVTNANQAAMKDRVATRVTNLEKDLTAQRALLDSQFAGVRAGARWFSNRICIK